MFSVIVLTYNSADVLPETLQAATRLSDDVHVVDSFSNDTTLEIAADHGVKITQHPFKHYAAQRNWAMANLDLKYDWVLHLDADERPDDALADAINKINLNGTDADGFFVSRATIFLGRWLKHGGLYPQWHMRLFRLGKGQCEDRLYDQHFFVRGKTQTLPGKLIDDQKMSLNEWVARHNRWADMEADEIVRGSGHEQIEPRAFGNPVEKKRFLKRVYYGLPLFVRPVLFFSYRYFLRGGFRDGREGLIYFGLQSLWFRFLVDAKVYEKTKNGQATKERELT